jgi:hypothetical protein
MKAPFDIEAAGKLLSHAVTDFKWTIVLMWAAKALLASRSRLPPAKLAATAKAYADALSGVIEEHEAPNRELFLNNVEKLAASYEKPAVDSPPS